MGEHGANDEKVIDHLEEVWASIEDVCVGLDAVGWTLPTDCPGWTVKDQVSHLIGIERMLLGDPAPDALTDVPDHVKNEFGALNEAWIQARRATPGPAVLAEFVETTRRRLDELRVMPPARFDEIGWSPVGHVPYREFMDTRVLDSWAHEQDIRRAVGRPGGRDGSGESTVIDRCGRTMAYVVGRKVAPPDGTSVVFVVTGTFGRRIPLVVSGGRAEISATEPPEPTVTLTMGQDVFWRLGFGREAPERALAAGEIDMAGDPALGQAVVEAMPFMI